MLWRAGAIKFNYVGNQKTYRKDLGDFWFLSFFAGVEFNIIAEPKISLEKKENEITSVKVFSLDYW